MVAARAAAEARAEAAESARAEAVEAAEAARAAAEAAASRESDAKTALATLEVSKGEVEAELRRRLAEMEEADEAKKGKASALKEKTRRYVAQLQESHKGALDDALAQAEAARAVASEAHDELERTSAAATSSIAELQAKLNATERAVTVAAHDAAAQARQAVASELAELEALRAQLAHESRGTSLTPCANTHTVTTPSTKPALAKPALAKPDTRPAGATAAGDGVASASASELERLERAWMASDAAHAAQLGALQAALEAEASAHSQHQLEADECKAEAAKMREQLAVLERQLATLTRAQHAAPDGDSGAVDGAGDDDAALRRLSAQQLRAEVRSQHACIGALDAALALAESRVRELERWRDLQSEAGLELEGG